jgi:hypothetical protein
VVAAAGKLLAASDA